MPVYKLLLPVISFSAQPLLPSLRRPALGVALEPREAERLVIPADHSPWADEGYTPPPADKPFG